MLEGLDQIDWASIQHRHDFPATRIPELFQLVLEGNQKLFPDVFAPLTGADALDLLFMERGDDPGNISYLPSTSYVVPFLIEILPHVNVHYRKKILSIFNELIGLPYGLRLGRDHTAYAIRQVKFVWDAADAIWQGFEVYKSIMSDPDASVRASAIFLLRHFYHKAAELFPFFLEQLNQETDKSNRAYLIHAAMHVVIYKPFQVYDDILARSKYADDLLTVFQARWDDVFRLEVAKAYVQVARKNTPFEYFEHPVPIDNQITKTLKQHVESLIHDEKPSELSFPDLIKYLRMIDMVHVSELLQRENLSPMCAHLICRELLDCDFERVDRSRSFISYQFPHASNAPEKRFKYVDNWHSRWLSSVQLEVLNLIVNCEVFWQFPTNVFSFFYALPDSRDELRALIEKKQIRPEI